MGCPHCGGLCVLELERDSEECQEVELVRCIQCGYRSDPVMELNRNGQGVR